MSIDVKALGAVLAAEVAAHVAPLIKRIEELESRKIPEAVKGDKGEPGESIQGEKGQDGKDGLGLAGAMIDRDGNLQITMTNGEVKNLGPVVGKDGSNGTNGTDGKDGKDGLSIESMEREYLPESHEIVERWTAKGQQKELRYPAGGIRPAGYWREGTKAKAGDAWVHDGSLWIAVKDNQAKPMTNDQAWIIAARKGRDGEDGRVKTLKPEQPIKVG